MPEIHRYASLIMLEVHHKATFTVYLKQCPWKLVPVWTFMTTAKEQKRKMQDMEEMFQC